ncbi:amino acid ABC transporter permease [Paenibacillus humicus]|nr:Probable glutamine ABC transporter permease protein GlnP [Paenibacillus sp. P22]
MDFGGAYSWHNLRFILEGFGYTLKLAFVAIILSFVLGVASGVIRYARIPVLSAIVGAIVETLRNLPLLLLILFAYIALPQMGIKLSIFWASVLALTAFEAAMISEIVRSGLASVHKGLIEAARSSGLTYIQTLRHIILPIGLRRMVPPTVSQFISLLKDTSLAVIISAPELMHNVGIVRGQQESYFFPVIFLAALLYFLVNYGLSLLSKRLEVNEGARRKPTGKKAGPGAGTKAAAEA